MPRPPKPPERRQRRNRRDLELVHDDQPAVPDLPRPAKELLKVTRDWWEELWTSPLAGAMTPTDADAVGRLALLKDERERVYREIRKKGGKRLVMGSQGQPVLNPLLKYMKDLDAEIRQLEDRVGLTPMARLKLGITFGQAQRSLADLNDGLEEDEDEEDDGGDPREAVDVG